MLQIKLLASIFVLLILACTVNAQEELVRQTPNGLVLEIFYYKDTAPAYQAITRTDGRPATAWYGRFGRIKNWQLPAGELPIRAVNIASRVDGEVASVMVSVFRGVKFHDQETMVGTYQLREDESVSVQELERFGVEPFRIGLKRLSPAVPHHPVVRSLAKSLEIVGIEPLTSTLPRYKLTVRNLSDKDIMALSIKIVGGGLGAMTSMPQGQEGLPLIRAGAFFASDQPLKTRSVQTPGGFTPDPPTSQETVIMAVVFEDGSYEGDPTEAAKFKAYSLGRKLGLARLLEVFKAVEAVPSDQEKSTPMALIKERVATISAEVDEATLAQLTREFPTLSPQERTGLKIGAEAALHHIKKELLDNLAAVEKNHPGDFRSWLANVEERYQTWLARL
jgi:hypothetical protein